MVNHWTVDPFTYSNRGQSLPVAILDMLTRERRDWRLWQTIHLRWECNHLSLGNVLLNTRLEGCLARVDRDLFAIRGNTVTFSA